MANCVNWWILSQYCSPEVKKKKWWQAQKSDFPLDLEKIILSTISPLDVFEIVLFSRRDCFEFFDEPLLHVENLLYTHIPFLL